jgi:hypothetical protein
MSSGFPPAKSNKSVSQASAALPNASNPVPTGKTIDQSLKVKAAGTKDAPGVEKNVNCF